MVDFVLSMDTPEQKCVVLKGMLKYPWIKDHVHTIGIDSPLSKNTIYEHKCLENIKKLYKHAGKFDDHKQLKVIIEAAMVSSTEVFTDNSPISPRKSTPVNKPSDRKSLCIFTNVLEVKKNCLLSSWICRI